VPGTADVLWWIFLATVLAVGVLVGALGVAMVIAQRRVVALHRTYAQRLLAAQEAERARVAREVHDDAIQRLGMLRHELQEFGRGDPGLTAAQSHRLGGIVGEVEDLAVTLRQLAHELHPAVIEQVGLVPALEQLADEVGRMAGLTVRLALPSAPVTLASDRALALFRIAQEALRNVIRHAGVADAGLALQVMEDDVELRIEDHGRGFDQAAGRDGAGIGIVGIQERARLLGGTAAIRSRPGEGTTVVARIPRVARDA
jgi:signal transduction histidine kinase